MSLCAKIDFMSKNSRQVLYLYISSLLGVLLGMGVSVLNTSFLDPKDYGDVRYVNNIMQFVSSVLLLGYFVSGSRLLALAKTKETSRSINGAMTCILGVTIVIAMVCMIIAYWIHKEWLNANVAPLFLIAVPVCASPLLLNYINTSFQGDNRIESMAIARLFPSFIYLVAGFAFYSHCGATSGKMILLQHGIIVIILSALIIFVRPSFKNLRKSLKELHEENKQYGLHVYIGSIVSVSLGYLAGITLGLFNEDNVQVGYYTLALTIATPLTLLPSIVGTAYFKKFATQRCIDSKVLILTALISVLSLLIFIVAIDPVVSFLYDEVYQSVAIYSSYLALGMIMHGIGDMFNRFLGSHGRGRALRNGAFICGFILVVGNVLFVYFWGIKGAIFTRVLASFSYMIMMIFYYSQFVRN